MIVTEDPTSTPAYARRLRTRSGVWWKRLLPVQAPYRWNLRRMRLGRTLDVGCGIGRNLVALSPESVGVDHNPDAIATAEAAGLTAHTSVDFPETDDADPAGYDALLFAHVIEHLTEADGVTLVQAYLRYLRSGGRVVFICPQERGYPTDPTHVRFCAFPELRDLAARTGLSVRTESSFPLPRPFGRLFAHNEFVVEAISPTTGRWA